MTLRLSVPRRLITARLVARRCRESDYDGLFAFLKDEPAIRYLNLSPDQKTSAVVQATLWSIIHSYGSDNPLFILTVVDRTTAAYLGFCGLSPLDDQPGVDYFYNIVRPLWGQGLATELGRAVVDHAFRDASVALVTAHIDPQNLASIRVATKLGLTDQGLVDHPDYDEPVRRMALDRQTFEQQKDRPA